MCLVHPSPSSSGIDPHAEQTRIRNLVVNFRLSPNYPEKIQFCSSADLERQMCRLDDNMLCIFSPRPSAKPESLDSSLPNPRTPKP